MKQAIILASMGQGQVLYIERRLLEVRENISSISTTRIDALHAVPRNLSKSVFKDVHIPFFFVVANTGQSNLFAIYKGWSKFISLAIYKILYVGQCFFFFFP